MEYTENQLVLEQLWDVLEEVFIYIEDAVILLVAIASENSNPFPVAGLSS
jgi:hypothetical protein